MGRNMDSERPGTAYGRWTVVEYAGKNKTGRNVLLCKCDCGTARIIAKEALVSGTSKSCGCLKREMSAERVARLHPGEAAMMAHYRSYTSGSVRRMIDFSLSIEEFILLTSKDCFYCGADPVEFKSRQVSVRKFSGYVANGIDRIDSSLGYIHGNVVPCCWSCNQGKGKKTKEQFINMCKSVALHSSN